MVGYPPPGVLYQPTPSRPANNYIGVNIVTTQSPEGMESPQGSPSDAEIDRAVEDILRDTDLVATTKREIRNKLEQRFVQRSECSPLISGKRTLGQGVESRHWIAGSSVF